MFSADKVEHVTVVLIYRTLSSSLHFLFCLFHSLNSIYLYTFGTYIRSLLSTFFSSHVHFSRQRCIAIHPPVSDNASCRFAHVLTSGPSMYQSNLFNTAMSLLPRIQQQQQQQQRIVNKSSFLQCLRLPMINIGLSRW